MRLRDREKQHNPSGVVGGPKGRRHLSRDFWDLTWEENGADVRKQVQRESGKEHREGERGTRHIKQHGVLWGLQLGPCRWSKNARSGVDFVMIWA